MRIVDYINKIYYLLQIGDIVLEDKTKIDEYLLSNDKFSIYYNIKLESISIFEKENGKRINTIYLDKNNTEKGLCIYSMKDFFGLYELIINICIDEDDIIQLEEELEWLVYEEKYEEASKLRDIISEIKEILKL